MFLHPLSVDHRCFNNFADSTAFHGLRLKSRGAARDAGLAHCHLMKEGYTVQSFSRNHMQQRRIVLRKDKHTTMLQTDFPENSALKNRKKLQLIDNVCVTVPCTQPNQTVSHVNKNLADVPEDSAQCDAARTPADELSFPV